MKSKTQSQKEHLITQRYQDEEKFTGAIGSRQNNDFVSYAKKMKSKQKLQVVGKLLEGGTAINGEDEPAQTQPDKKADVYDKPPERTGAKWKVGNSCICVFVLILVVFIPLLNFFHLMQIDQYGPKSHHHGEHELTPDEKVFKQINDTLSKAAHQVKEREENIFINSLMLDKVASKIKKNKVETQVLASLNDVTTQVKKSQAETQLVGSLSNMINQVKAEQAQQQAAFTLNMVAQNFQEDQVVSLFDQVANGIRAQEVATNTIDMAVQNIKMEEANNFQEKQVVSLFDWVAKGIRAEELATGTLDMAIQDIKMEKANDFQENQVVSLFDQVANSIRAEELTRSTLDMAIQNIKMEKAIDQF